MDFKTLLLNSGLTEEQANQFAEWSFGPDYETQKMTERVNAWNQLHGHLFIVNKADRITDSIKKMYEIYYELNKDNRTEKWINRKTGKIVNGGDEVSICEADEWVELNELQKTD